MSRPSLRVRETIPEARADARPHQSLEPENNASAFGLGILSQPLGRGTALVLALALAGGACNDNVTCVFTTGCQGGGGQISENPASRPIDGEWIVDGPPEIESVFPSGMNHPGTTPIVLVFSESMQALSLSNAIEIVPLVGAGVEGDPVAGVSQALISDGRVLVLLLVGSTLPPSDYLVRIADEAAPLDLTGQALGLAAFTQLGSFNVGTTPQAAPQLVTTFPADGDDNQAETSEIVAVFDRPVLQSSVDTVSFDVKVNGANPANDPPAIPITLGSGLTDTRVFLYRSRDADGLPAPLGTDAEVTLALSPASHPIKEMDNGILAPDTITFDTLPFAPPLGASLMSDPNDAIGLANLTDQNAEELVVEVELDAAEPNDSIDLFLFGVQKSVQEMPPLIALQRSVRLQGTAPIQVATFLREDVGLQRSNDPDDTRFNDGSVTFAFRARRGGLVTPVRLLDLDPDPEVILDALLDTVAPTIEGLVGSSSTSVFRSDQRGLSLAGTSSEELRVVEVSTPSLTNGTMSPVVGTTPVGDEDEHLFLAAPVPLGVLTDGSTTYTAVARDLALNPSPAVNGTYTQLGAVGPGPFTPGAEILVEVFDSRTLAPLAGTLVLVHSDRGNGVDFPFVRSGTTGPDGRISLATEGAPSIGAIVTVVRTGFDLFTLHDAPFTRLSVPLNETGRAPGLDTGVATTSDAAAVLFLPGLDVRFEDSRRALELPRGFPELTCTSSQGTLTCSHQPKDIRPGRLGSRAFFAGDFGQTEAVFQASQLLRAFALSLPFEATAPGAPQPGVLEVPFLLDDPSTPAAERAQAVPAFTFQAAASGVNLSALDDDEDTTGEPRANVDALVPGIPGSIAVSQALAFDQGGGQWTVRAAMPGAITAEGSLGSDERVDTDPFVRVEVLDTEGNAAGVRPRLSNLPIIGPPGVFRALAVPTQIAPAEDAATGGEAFTILLTHAIADDRSEPGLYRVDLVDSAGRGWSLFRVDPAGAAPVELRVVDVADAGVTGTAGLLDGALESRASAYAWTSLGTTGFLLSDLEREFELFSRAAPLPFSKP